MSDHQYAPDEGALDTDEHAYAGRPHYQIAVTRCPICGKTSIDPGGRRHRLEPAIAEMIDCDAQIIGLAEASQPT